jgi:mycothiol synthase
MRLRAPEPDDAPAVFAVMAARDTADIGAPDCTLGDVHDDWGATEFELSADARVVEEGGRIVGYAIIRNPGALVAVDPSFEGRGAGAQLLNWTESRDRELGRPRHRQWIAASNDRARALLVGAGYELARSHYRMWRALGSSGSEAAVSCPDDVTLRPIDVAADAEELHALDAASFAGAGDYDPMSLIAFREDHLQTHDADPQLSCIAERGGRIIGFLLTRRWDDESVGYISILAVRPGEQGRGVGTMMLRRAFELYAAGGLSQAQLGVSSQNPEALKLYERVGLQTRFRFDTYERLVGGAP